MEDILIISNYYPPEKGAAANRIQQMAIKLDENNYNVSVICPLPNYPKGKLFPEYKGKFFMEEKRNNINIKRLWIYPSNSKNGIIRILSVLSFSTVLFAYLLFKKTPNKVIIQSPPILLSFISVLVLSLKNKKIILNVSDLWPLAAVELKALKENNLPHKILLLLENYIYRKSSVIFCQSNEIIAHIHTFYRDKKCVLYRNFPDHQLKKPNTQSFLNEPIKIFYAGLLGVAQGVLELCQKIKLDGLNVELHVFGDGSEKSLIKEYLKQSPKENIFFHGMLERKDLHAKLTSFDIAIVPLKTRIYGSVPSKIFEYSALGFPILYCGGGEGESIIRKNNLGWVADAGEFTSINNTLIKISETGKGEIQLMKKKVLLHATRNFNLDNQIKELIADKFF
jgi:glycosyltransferase involved in cell wall biosynthesis